MYPQEINYHESLDQLKAAVTELLDQGAGVIYTTQCRKKLNAHYLRTMQQVAAKHGLDPATVVQHFNCSTCARFMARVGHLAIANEHGIRSVYWNPEVVTNPVMKDVVAEMKRYVESTRIIGVFNPYGPYKYYEEFNGPGFHSNEWRHYYIPQTLLTHRHQTLNHPLELGNLATKFDQVSAAIRFFGEVDLNTIVYVDGLFKSRKVEHKGGSSKNLEDLTKAMIALQTTKVQPAYETETNEYSKETMVINALWIQLMQHQNLLSIRGSILGQFIRMVHEALKTHDAGALEETMKFWRTQTDGLHYMRTTREAGEAQIQKTARFIEEGGWAASMKQVEAAEIEVPVIWEAKSKWVRGAETQASSSDFAAFAKRKGVETNSPNRPIPIDLGHFVNEFLPYVESMAINLTGSQFKPVLLNRMANPDAKPIFIYDTEEKRCPFIAWCYERPFSTNDLLIEKPKSPYDEVLVPVLSVTTSSTIGYRDRDSREAIALLLGGMHVPVVPSPALFAESLKKEFYEHRRAVEDYCRDTKIPRASSQQALGLFFGSRNPNVRENVYRVLHVRMTDEGVARFGKRELSYQFDVAGWQVEPDLDKFRTITNRTPAAEPEVAQTASDVGIQPV